MNARRDEYLNDELRKEKAVRRREKQVFKQNKAERKERCQRRRDQKAAADQVAAEAAETKAMEIAELDSRTRWVQIEEGARLAGAPRRRPAAAFPAQLWDPASRAGAKATLPSLAPDVEPAAVAAPRTSPEATGESESASGAIAVQGAGDGPIQLAPL